MSLLYPFVLWLIVPLFFWWYKSQKNIYFTTHILVLFLILIALARPVQKQILNTGPIESKDIIIALDISYSMQATDIVPSRYGFAKKCINQLLEKNMTDNIMLIAFTSNPLLLSAPTTDHKLIAMALQSLNPQYILTKGTSLRKLFQKIATLHNDKKYLLLLTDGGDEDTLTSLLPIIKKADISLTTLAIGNPQGSTIKTSKGTLLKDKNNNLVISTINPILESLTLSTHGNYIQATTNSLDTCNAAYHALIQQIQSTQVIHKNQYTYTEWYQPIIFLALVLFLILHTRMVKYLVILFMFLGLQSEASFFDNFYLHQAYKSYENKKYTQTLQTIKNIDTPYLQTHYLQANCYYQEGKYTQAIILYKKILSTAIKTKQYLYYNIANAYTHLKKYSLAREYYKKVLHLGKDNDALFNLVLIARIKDTSQNTLGISHPKSKSSQNSKSESKQKESKKKSETSAGSGSGKKSKTTKKDKKKQKLQESKDTQKHPLGSKVYELINKGYIHETHPW